MLLSAFYAAATWVQSWRLSSLKNKIVHIGSQLNGTVVLYKVPEHVHDKEGGSSVQVPSVTSHLCENVDSAKLGDLLWTVGDKRLCSVFPRQTVNAARWVGFTRDQPSQFPIPISGPQDSEDSGWLGQDRLHVLVEAELPEYEVTDPHHFLAAAEFCELSQFGVLRAWRADSRFGLLLESDPDHLTRLGVAFMQSTLALQDGMEVLRIQTVDVSGTPCALLHADSIPVPRAPQPSGDSEHEDWTDESNNVTGMTPTGAAPWLLMSPVQWRSHVELLRSFSSAAEGSMSPGPPGTPVKGVALKLGADRTPTLVTSEEPKVSPSNGAVPSLTTGVGELKKTPSVDQSAGSVRSSGVTSHSDSFYSCASHDTAPKMSEGGSLERLATALEDATLEETAQQTDSSTTSTAEAVDTPRELPPSPRPTPTPTPSSTPQHNRGSTVSLPPPPPVGRGSPRRAPPSPARCPNVLVLSDTSTGQEHVKSLLRATLKKYRYTVYAVSGDQLRGPGWQASTALVVVCGSVPDGLAPALVTYLVGGGKLLCLCSDLLGTVLPEFRTAEVRANELVTFSYQRWRKIKMLHHVFCYQQSPVHSKFGAAAAEHAKGVTPSAAVELRDREGASHRLDISVLGVEETWHTPSLILAAEPRHGGKIVFSQVHLEVDPLQYASDNTTYTSLKQSNQARLEIIRDILGTQLGLECSETGGKVGAEMLSTAYFLGRHETKLEFLSSLGPRLQEQQTLTLDSMSLQFCGKSSPTPEPPTPSRLPVMLHACPPHFNTVEYFENLHSEHLGRLVIYADVMNSSMEVLAGPQLWHGLAAVPRQQLKGRGRAGNEWLSPEGCAMFTVQIQLPLNSRLGRRLSLVQHLAALAVVIAVREAPGYEDTDLRLKWPNDIYAGDWSKLGGLLVTSSIIGDKAVCNIGCGLNLSNSEPTTSVHDLARECGSSAPPMSLEKFLALTFSRLEGLLQAAQESEQGMAQVLQLYYAYWLHGGAEVTVLSEDGSEQRAEVQGLDDYGFLSVRGKDGNSFSVHPDGNSFDMLQGLIRPKN